MGKLSGDVPFYRPIGHGCYEKISRGGSDIVYDDDVTGRSRRRDTAVIVGCFIFSVFLLLLIIFMFNF